MKPTKAILSQRKICAAESMHANRGRYTGKGRLFFAAVVLSLSVASVARADGITSATILPDYVPNLVDYFAANGFNGTSDSDWFNMPIAVGNITGNGLLDSQDISIYGEVTNLALYQAVASTPLSIGSQLMTDANGQSALLPGFTFFTDAALTIPYANKQILVIGIDSSADPVGNLHRKIRLHVDDKYKSVVTAKSTLDSPDNVIASETFAYINTTGLGQIIPLDFFADPRANNLETFSSTSQLPEPGTMALTMFPLLYLVQQQLRRRRKPAA